MRNQLPYLELVPLGEAAAATHHVIQDRIVRRRDANHVAELRLETALALAALGTVYSRSEQRPLSFSEVESRVRGNLADLCIRRSELLRCIELLRRERAQKKASDLRAESIHLRQWTSEVIRTSQDTIERATATMRRSEALHKEPRERAEDG